MLTVSDNDRELKKSMLTVSDNDRELKILQHQHHIKNNSSLLQITVTITMPTLHIIKFNYYKYKYLKKPVYHHKTMYKNENHTKIACTKKQTSLFCYDRFVTTVRLNQIRSECLQKQLFIFWLLSHQEKIPLVSRVVLEVLYHLVQHPRYLWHIQKLCGHLRIFLMMLCCRHTFQPIPRVSVKRTSIKT